MFFCLKNLWEHSFVLTKCRAPLLTFPESENTSDYKGLSVLCRGCKNHFFCLIYPSFWIIRLIRQKWETHTVIFLTNFTALHLCPDWIHCTKMKFSIKDFSSKYEQIYSFHFLCSDKSGIHVVYCGTWRERRDANRSISGFLIIWETLRKNSGFNLHSEWTFPWKLTWVLITLGKYSAVVVIPQEER